MQSCKTYSFLWQTVKIYAWESAQGSPVDRQIAAAHKIYLAYVPSLNFKWGSLALIALYLAIARFMEEMSYGRTSSTSDPIRGCIWNSVPYATLNAEHQRVTKLLFWSRFCMLDLTGNTRQELMQENRNMPLKIWIGWSFGSTNATTLSFKVDPPSAPLVKLS